MGIGRRIQRKAKGLLVAVGSPRPAETAQHLMALIAARLPGGRARDAEAFWWFDEVAQFLAALG